jgi:light-regulated signal transduction histidine kinase (bacteriophytochrome)
MQPPDQLRDRRQSDREWQLFLDRAIHDLNAPLRGVSTSAALLSESCGLSDDARQLIARLQEGAVKMSAVLKALAEYSTALGIDDSSFGPVPMDTVVRSARAAMAALIRETGAGLQCASLPSVHGNWEQLVTLFHHLLKNGLQYRGADPPCITISAEQDRDDWRFAVGDNGIGIDARYWDSIFAPFERLHGNDRPGAGLGLAVCKRIVELHGGRIWVDSVVGEGSTFFFTLPATGGLE